MRDAQLQHTRGAFVQHARTGQPAMRNGAKLLAGTMAPSCIYPCKPGGPNNYVYLFTSHANPEHWRRLLQVIGQKADARRPALCNPRRTGVGGIIQSDPCGIILGFVPIPQW